MGTIISMWLAKHLGNEIAGSIHGAAEARLPLLLLWAIFFLPRGLISYQRVE